MTPGFALSTKPESLGVLSIHLDGNQCRVACSFCYLGKRQKLDSPSDMLPLAEELLQRLEYDEVAIALSEPWSEPVGPLALRRLLAAARRPVALTTTLTLASQHPEIFAGVARVNLSFDSYKGVAQPYRSLRRRQAGAEVAEVATVTEALRQAQPELDIVVLATLDTPEMAERLVSPLLAQLLALPSVDKVALNALKPPPDWCDRAFWMRTLSLLRPLLAEHLDRRLFLDCWVAARLLALGGCPARPDLSPGSGGIAFRSCVYQPAPEVTVADAGALVEHLRGFVPPAVCPFPIR